MPQNLRLHEHANSQGRPRGVFSPAVRILDLGNRVHNPGLKVDLSFGSNDSSAPGVLRAGKPGSNDHPGTGQWLVVSTIVQREVHEGQLFIREGKSDFGKIYGIDGGQRGSRDYELPKIDLLAADSTGKRSQDLGAGQIPFSLQRAGPCRLEGSLSLCQLRLSSQ